MLNRLSASLRLCAILLIAAHATAEEPLTWKWAEGDTARYQMTQKMKMSMDAGPAGEVDITSQMNMVMRWAVDEVTDEGARLRQSIERIVMENNGPGGQSYTYDSQDEDPPVGMAALIAPMFEAMVENDFLITMRPTGEITDVTLSEELAEAFKRLPGGAVSADMIQQMSKQGSIQFPDEPLALGDSWTTETTIPMPQVGTLQSSMTLTYEGPREVDGREYEAFTTTVAVASLPGEDNPVDLSMETIDTTGEMLFDREAGQLFRSRLLQTMEVTVTIGEEPIVNEVEQAMEMRALAKGEEASISIEQDAEASMAE